VGQPEPRKPDPDEPRTDEKIARMFPDRGEFPGNEIRVDPDAPPVPDIGHPGGRRDE